MTEGVLEILYYTVPLVTGAAALAYAFYRTTWVNAQDAGTDRMKESARAVREGAMFGLRQVLKVIPWLIPVAAVQDYAATYALGRAASVFMAARKANIEADAEEVRKVFYESLKEAFRMGRRLSTS